MTHIILNGAALRDRAELHNQLADRLSLPAWYGRTLDALHDCLTDLGDDVTVLLRNSEAMTEALGKYGETVLRVFRDAAEENPHLTFCVLD